MWYHAWYNTGMRNTQHNERKAETMTNGTTSYTLSQIRHAICVMARTNNHQMYLHSETLQSISNIHRLSYDALCDLHREVRHAIR
jgi:protein tyrosine phosphatase